MPEATDPDAADTLTYELFFGINGSGSVPAFVSSTEENRAQLTPASGDVGTHQNFLLRATDNNSVGDSSGA